MKEENNDKIYPIVMAIILVILIVCGYIVNY